jgi:glycosyltransferase involved in cell wall biosynthesis
MKKVLIIANLFYASPRIPGLAKYLPEFGWEPIILTVPLGENPDSSFGPPDDFRMNQRVVETYSYRSERTFVAGARSRMGRLKPFLRVLYRRYTEIAHYPDKEKKWIPIAVDSAKELLKNEHVDAMISSFSPATCHLVAKKLEEKFNIPWIADFRDLWTQNHNYPYSQFRKFFERKLEFRTLSTADALVTTSKPWAENLKAMHRKEAYVITNGFDPEKMNIGRNGLTSSFTITYTGQIYPRQDVTKFLVALEGLISQGRINSTDVEVRFYGPTSELLTTEIERHQLSSVVKQYGVVSREDSFNKQRESQLLLLLNWDDAKEKGVFTGKIFEYLAAQRPILSTGGLRGDVVEALLKETRAGIYCPAVENIREALCDSYNEYKSKGRVLYDGDVNEICKYSYREMAKQFAEVLNRFV